jgi:hypothetical protein
VLATGAPITASADPTDIPMPVRDHGRGAQTEAVVSGTVTVKDFPTADWNEGSVDAELFSYDASRRAWRTTGRVDLVPSTGRYEFAGLEHKRYRLVFTNRRGAGVPSVVTAPFLPVGPSTTINATIDANHDASGDGFPDIIARDSKGVVWVYRGTGDGRIGTRVKATSGLSTITAVAAAGDLNSDGIADLLARDRSGTLWLYRAKGVGSFGSRPSFGSRVKVGSGFSKSTAIVSAGDQTGDLRPDVLARDESGALWLYEGTGLGGFYSPTLVGTGYDAWASISGAGDLDGDALDDLVAADADGALWLLAGRGSATFAAPRPLGIAGATAAFSAGDLTGDGRDDLVTRDAAGALWVHAADGAGGLDIAERFATGFAKLAIAH